MKAHIRQRLPLFFVLDRYYNPLTFQRLQPWLIDVGGSFNVANSAKGEGIESLTVYLAVSRTSVVDWTQQKGKRVVGTAQISPVRHQLHPAFIVDINGEAEYSSKSKTKT